jgi:hypothetical protein
MNGFSSGHLQPLEVSPPLVFPVCPFPSENLEQRKSWYQAAFLERGIFDPSTFWCHPLLPEACSDPVGAAGGSG